jgi:hypothetical protein
MAAGSGGAASPKPSGIPITANSVRLSRPAVFFGGVHILKPQNFHQGVADGSFSIQHITEIRALYAVALGKGAYAPLTFDRFTTTLIFCNTSMSMGLLASDVRVSVPSHDSVNSFGSFSAVRAWMPKTSGSNANAVVLVMHLIALLAPHGA